MWRGPVVGPALRKRACPARPDKPGGRGRANSTPRHPAGGGEGGITPALGVIINAVVDAVADLGVTHIDMPASPERVWQAIREAKAACRSNT